MTPYKFLHAAASAILALAMSSCIFPFEVDYAEQTGNLPLVVEGDIQVGGSTIISLDHVRPFQEPEDGEWQQYVFQHVTGTIEGEDGTQVTDSYYNYLPEFLSSYMGPSTKGKLYFDTRDLRPDQRYRLLLSVQGPEDASPTRYESDWVPVNPAPVIDGLSYIANIPDEELQIGLSMHCRGAHHFRWTFEEDWEFHSELNSYYMFDWQTHFVRPYDDYHTENTYYCWAREASYAAQTFSTAYQTDDRFEDLNFHAVKLKDKRLQMLYRIRVHLSAISDASYSYWETIRQNSEEQGSLFSPTPSQVTGNIHCTSNPDALVIGYIDACQEVMGEMYYDNSNEHYFIPGPPVQFDAIEMSNIPEINYSLFRNSLLPYQTVSTGGGEPNYIWAPAYCVDCRRNGGTKHKPADWPRD